jgi:hypothetical protein
MKRKREEEMPHSDNEKILNLSRLNSLELLQQARL